MSRCSEYHSSQQPVPLLKAAPRTPPCRRCNKADTALQLTPGLSSFQQGSPSPCQVPPALQGTVLCRRLSCRLHALVPYCSYSIHHMARCTSHDTGPASHAEGMHVCRPTNAGRCDCHTRAASAPCCYLKRCRRGTALFHKSQICLWRAVQQHALWQGRLSRPALPH